MRTWSTKFVSASTHPAFTSPRAEDILSFEGASLDGGVTIEVVDPTSLPATLRSEWEHLRLFHIRGKASGLEAHIAIHRLMPVHNRLWAIGGTRNQLYTSTEESILDALRLSRAMTYKCGGAGIRIGGGKCDINCARTDPRRPEILADFARALEFLQVIFTGRDMNISEEDAFYLAERAPHSIAGVASSYVGGQDPVPTTALGVYHGIKAYAEALHLPPSATVSLQGSGNIGGRLIPMLLEDGATIYACDTDPQVFAWVQDKFHEAMRSRQLIWVNDPKDIYDAPAAIFIPSAIGGTLNGTTIPRLHTAGVKIVAGPANNQLATPQDGILLHEADILWAVDYIINAGGLIAVAADVMGYDPAARVNDIVTTLALVLKESERTGEAPAIVADRIIFQKMEDEGWNYLGGQPLTS